MLRRKRGRPAPVGCLFNFAAPQGGPLPNRRCTNETSTYEAPQGRQPLLKAMGADVIHHVGLKKVVALAAVHERVDRYRLVVAARG